ncbi:MAG: 30S ribosomal protein S20 [Puniceicoccales bacterium]|jgi:small subunit ribosomal protein S20|nr:30S ribosomal protein S20 [Puniceicoccales bacterium]
MANTKSAQKNIRKAATRTVANKATKSRLKTLSKAVNTAVKSGDTKKVAETGAACASAYDKAVKTGVIHKNKASRMKSKLAKAAKPAAK